MTTIKYAGTTDQWKAIEKGSSWCNGAADFVIHCTDGTVDKAGNVTSSSETTPDTTA